MKTFFLLFVIYFSTSAYSSESNIKYKAEMYSERMSALSFLFVQFSENYEGEKRRSLLNLVYLNYLKNYDNLRYLYSQDENLDQYILIYGRDLTDIESVLILMEDIIDLSP